MEKVNRRNNILVIAIDILLIIVYTVYFMLFITDDFSSHEIIIGVMLGIIIISLLVKTFYGLSKLR